MQILAAQHTGPLRAKGRKDRAASRAIRATIMMSAGALAACSQAAEKPKHTQTLQYVLASYDFQFYQTPGAKEECPAGYTPTTREEWEALYPTDDERKSQLARCLAINDRGPGCENVWAAPDTANDPLPYRWVQGKISYGVNLDGTTDGHATALTCKHDKFVDPSGKTGVDNQYYRFFGCERFVQGGQHHAPAIDKKRTIQYQSSRILLEVKGVDNRQNDDDVDVTLYRGKDALMTDASENAIAWQSQRVDPTIPPVHLHGRIVNGTLITDPADVFWEGELFDRRQLIHGMSLRLKLDGPHAKGVRVGYIDVDRLWQSYSRTAKWGGQIYGASGPSAYTAMHALADGYKDKSGQCTALSSSEQLDFVRAYIVQPSQQTAQASP